ncbi:hypothetical protein GALMADRAFT_468398 [Galerina marginata CBS 339.88]|uniref:Uncharacterized protein n=1 Tax=Galerina marginata (strain CBS 339.88) TaxID=685588 RepID=A0A067TB64_GALM3|nr:hypothetical protein GALMADRAFT_468398 [Galerina marginata CBS 339.88]
MKKSKKLKRRRRSRLLAKERLLLNRNRVALQLNPDLRHSKVPNLCQNAIYYKSLENLQVANLRRRVPKRLQQHPLMWTLWKYQTPKSRKSRHPLRNGTGKVKPKRQKTRRNNKTKLLLLRKQGESEKLWRRTRVMEKASSSWTNPRRRRNGPEHRVKCGIPTQRKSSQNRGVVLEADSQLREWSQRTRTRKTRSRQRKRNARSFQLLLLARLHSAP